MTFRRAAEEVLRSAKGTSMTAEEITDEATRRGLLATHGKTPLSTMTATLYRCPPDGPIVREAVEGKRRARLGPVRWKYVSESVSTARGTARR
jgi:hypothetical protein